jgi:methylmalonyl-CoA epimerase
MRVTRRSAAVAERRAVTAGVVHSIHHVGILVRDVDAALPFYVDWLQLSVVGDEWLPQVGVRLTYLTGGSTLIQLVQPTHPGPLQDHLERYGEGFHHICLAVDNLEATLQRVAPGAAVVIQEAVRGRRTVFLPPGPNGVRIELLEVTD